MDFFVDLAFWQWMLIFVSGMLIGMAKTGVAGISMVTIPIMAAIFGGKPSTAVLLPALIVADIFAVSYYNMHAQWKYLFKTLPWAFLGLILGVWVGTIISNDQIFKILISILVVIGVAIMVWRDLGLKTETIPSNWGFAMFLGVSGGFASMIGNAAGPIMAIYFLAMKLQKNAYIGTIAWFFLVINITKVPLQLYFWHNFSLPMLSVNLFMIPAIGLGAFLGIQIVKRISDNIYRWFVIGVTILSAGVMFL